MRAGPGAKSAIFTLTTQRRNTPTCETIIERELLCSYQVRRLQHVVLEDDVRPLLGSTVRAERKPCPQKEMLETLGPRVPHVICSCKCLLTLRIKAALKRAQRTTLWVQMQDCTAFAGGANTLRIRLIQ